LIIEPRGGAAVPFALDATLWQPIKKKKPAVGCKYRKGPVVVTAILKAGKRLKVVAKSNAAIVPLATDPRPVRVSVRHGSMQHCFEFTEASQGQYKAHKKLLVRGAPAASACPVSASPNGAFVR
jgi:hypothetical protein